jgi:hypothetical protein
VNILESVLSAGSTAVVGQLANQFGINTEQAGSAVSALLPALAGGLKEHLSSGSGSALSNLISGGSLGKFADDPSSLGTPAALTQGKSILNQIFGTGDLTNIASSVGEKVGISSSIVTSMLPIAASLLGGLLTKSMASGQGNLTDIVGSIASGGHHGLLDAVKGFASKVLG